MTNDIFTAILIIILIYKSIKVLMGLFSGIGQAFDSAAGKAEKI
jgi:hypothetical protein